MFEKVALGAQSTGERGEGEIVHAFDMHVHVLILLQLNGAHTSDFEMY